jgi:hypothetical protein
MPKSIPILVPAHRQFLAEDRLLDSLIRTKGGCWEWQHCRHPISGYGKLRLFGRDTTTHRIAYTIFCGPILAGLHVLHHCDNPPCCNPAHLFLGTDQDNVLDSIRKGRRHAQRHPRLIKLLLIRACPKRVKLTPDSVRQIRLLAQTMSLRKLAVCFGVDHKTIHRVLNGQAWKSVFG